MRERYGLEGVPLVIDFMTQSRPRGPDLRRPRSDLYPSRLPDDDPAACRRTSTCSPPSPSPRATRTRSADQISDGVLDAVHGARTPSGRVACETLVNTGLAVVSGEISTDVLPRHARDRPRDDPRDRLRRRATTASTATPRRARPRSTSSRPTSPRASTRPTRRAPTRPTTTSSTRRRGRPGNDVRLRHARDRGADADADRARPPARRTGWPRCARTATLAYLRPDGKTQVTVRYRERPPGRDREAPDLDPARRRRRLRDARSSPTSGSTSCMPVLPGRAVRRDEAARRRRTSSSTRPASS